MTPDRQHALTELRSAIDRLPRGTREAMLAGVRSNTVITGAYSDRNRGVCPMLAAHRCGGRTDFLSFADAWDQFTGVYGRSICRSATGYEVRTLVNQLSESLGLVTSTSDLSLAIAEHQAMAARRAVGGLRAAPRAASAPAPVEIAPDLSAAIADHQSMVRERYAELAPAVAEAKAPRERVKAEPSLFAAAIAEHQAAVEARQAEHRDRPREEELDLAAAIADHQATARSRREREAAQVGVLWMDGDDFQVSPAPQPEPEHEPRRTDRRRELVLA